mgnify:CR=1 FL=1|tara:strand:+ start:37377 stop:38708 length:1332 start_codon:yes stop_codon:yes gene_type:complete
MQNFETELSFEEVIGFFERNYLKNRTIVSRDVESILDDVAKTTNLEMTKHRFKTGEVFSTWEVPPSWNVKQAWLKDKKGKLIGSYEMHPLFVSPFSCAVDQEITFKELEGHIFSEPNQPDAFAYNWRYAMDYRLRLKEWGISLPLNVVNELRERGEDEEYEILIDIDVEDGELLIGDITLKGESEKTICFLSDHCHPGQVNDSFTGIGLFMMVMATLAKMPNRKYTYKFLIMPETVGSAIYITKFYDELKKNFIGTMFSEMVGWGENWYIKKTREANTYMDEIADALAKKWDGLNPTEFFSVYGNDELMFNNVGTNIPSLSLQKHPFIEYHTSNDTPDRVQESDMQRAFDITMDMVNIIENDAIYKFNQPVPFWMTRFDLFADDQWQTEDFLKNFDIVYKNLDGDKSLVEVANKSNCSFDYIYQYVQKMKEYNLITRLSSVHD